MFTGLIEGVGKIKGIRRGRDDMSMTVMPPFDVTDCRVGESICVDGVCLTVTGVSGGIFSVDVSAETVSRSTIGLLKQGDEVNLERSLRLSDRLGGHLVSGHVDGTGKILKKISNERSWIIEIGIEGRLSRYIIEKGSIAVDGISLTVNRCSEISFDVNIIPQTARKTGLLKKRVGDLVNIETDMIGKYVEKFLKAGDSRDEKADSISIIDRDMLKKYGFGD
jgi:riboflavin synthase